MTDREKILASFTIEDLMKYPRKIMLALMREDKAEVRSIKATLWVAKVWNKLWA